MNLPLKYHWQNLFARKTATVLTLGIIAAVVGLFCWMFGFSQALSGSLRFANDESKLIILKPGASAESNSALDSEDLAKLAMVQSVSRDESGGLLRSPEMLVQIQLRRVRDGGATLGNIAIRGVTEAAFKVHNQIKLTGPMFSTSVPEVIVGATIAKQFEGLNIGDTLDLGFGGQREYKIVGYFTAGGGPMESEIWGYLPSLKDAYRRTMDSSITLKIDSPEAAKQAKTLIEGPSITLNAKTEKEYWEEQTSLIRAYLVIVRVLVIIMSMAAVFAIANTMHASVMSRTRELAMLRTIGYGPPQILMGVVFESIMLSLPGALLGYVACECWLYLVGNTKDMFGANTFTLMAFEIHLSPEIVGLSVGLACMVGAVGALVPAWRAAKVDVIQALRR